MMRAFRPVLTLVLLIAATAMLAGQSLPWPRAIVVVFERRIPREANDAGKVGVQLRAVRENVTRMLSRPDVMSPGDHVFVFADGLSSPGLRCLLDNICGGAGDADTSIEWNEPAAPEKFLAHLLQLPLRARPLTAGARQPDFLHLPFDGRIEPIDCAIRRHVTGPMTRGTGNPSCPIEGTSIDTTQTRNISRLEISYPLQIRAALRETPPTAYRSVTWVYALLREKSFLREDTIPGIRQDFGARGEPLVDYYEQGQDFYQRAQQEIVKLQPFGRVVRFDTETRSTSALLKRLRAPDALQVTVGRAHPQPLRDDLVLRRGAYGGDWSPALDSMQIAFRLAPDVAGRIEDARVRIDGQRSVVLATRPDGKGGFVATDDGLDATLHEALSNGASMRFDVRIDLLLSGTQDRTAYDWPPLNGTERNAPSAEEP